MACSLVGELKVRMKASVSSGDAAYERAQKLLATLEQDLGSRVAFRESRAVDQGERSVDGAPTLPRVVGDAQEEFEEVAALPAFVPGARFPPNVDLETLRGGERERRVVSVLGVAGGLEEKSAVLSSVRDDHLEYACQMAREEKNPSALLEQYGLCCTNFIRRARLVEGGSTEVGFTQSSRVLERQIAAASDERAVWDLVYYLHQPRQYPAPQDEDYDDQPITHSKTGQERVNFVYRNDLEFQLLHRVTLWLHETAHKSLQYEGTIGKLSEIGAVSYLPKTCATLQGKLQDYGSASVVKLGVVDPDVQLGAREGIHPDDKDTQASFLEHLWVLIRTGAFYHSFQVADSAEAKHHVDGTYSSSTEQAIKLCSTFAEPWRAASLLGGTPDSCVLKDGVLVRQGNVYRAIWKHCCLELMNRFKGKNMTEAAIYAMMAGEMDFLLGSQLCNSWLDNCWVYFRCLVQAKVDEAILAHRRTSLSKTPNVAGPVGGSYEQDLDARARRTLTLKPETIFSNLEACGNSLVEAQARRWHHRLEVSLIRGTFHELLIEELCPFYCGEEWILLAFRTVADICGKSYASTHMQDIVSEVEKGGFTGLDSHLSDRAISSAPCWSDPNIGVIAPNILRLLAHLVLYLDHFKHEHAVVKETSELNPVAVIAVLTAYLRFLIASGKFECVAFFFEDIPRTLYHALFAAILEALIPADDETKCKCLNDWTVGIKELELQAMVMQCFLNVFNAWRSGHGPCNLVVEATASSGAETRSRTRSEWTERQLIQRVVKCLGWFLLVPSLRLEGVAQANLLLREFVGRFYKDDATAEEKETLWKEINAVVDLIELEELPQIFEAVKQVRLTPLHQQDVLREFGCWRLYVQAQTAFRDWQDRVSRVEEELATAAGRPHVIQATSRLPSEIKSAEEFADTTLVELIRLSEFVAEAIASVLTFEGGWLVDQLEPEEQASETLCGDEIETLMSRRFVALGSLKHPGQVKKACVPKLVVLCHKVLEGTAKTVEQYSSVTGRERFHLSNALSMFQQSLLLADMVAGNKHSLFRCHTAPEMTAFLGRLHDSAKQVMRLLGSVQVGKLKD